MGLSIKLTTQQINQIASCILPTDVKVFIDNHMEEYEQFLQEEQNKHTPTNNFTNDNSKWAFYTDDTICKIKITKNERT